MKLVSATDKLLNPFDIMSLFRNIPLSEAVDIAINLTFENSSDITFTKLELQEKNEQTWMEEVTNVKPIVCEFMYLYFMRMKFLPFLNLSQTLMCFIAI